MMNSTPEWIARSVSRLRTAAPAADKAGDKAADRPARAGLDKSVSDVVAKVAVPRSTHERLQATLRRAQEALSPRALHRLLTDEPARLANHDFGGRQGAASFGRIRVDAFDRCQITHRARLLTVQEHVGHAVLEYLEAADRLPELLAVLGVLQSGRVDGLHDAAGFST